MDLGAPIQTAKSLPSYKNKNSQISTKDVKITENTVGRGTTSGKILEFETEEKCLTWKEKLENSKAEVHELKMSNVCFKKKKFDKATDTTINGKR